MDAETRRPGRPPLRLNPDASAQARLGARLRELRNHRGLVLAELGTRVGYSGTHLGAVERATATVSRDVIASCDRELDANGELLRLFDAAERERADTRARRRIARRHANGGTGARPASAGEANGSAAVDWDALEAIVARGWRPARRVVEELDRVTASFRDLYHHLPSEALIGPAHAHLQTLTTLLDTDLCGATSRHLARLAQEMAGLLAWLQADLGHHADSRATYRLADTLAAASGDRVLGGYVRGFEALTHTTPDRTRHDVRCAGEQIGQRGPARTRAWLGAIDAHTCARMSDKAAAFTALRSAEQALDRAVPGSDPDWMFRFDEVHMTVQRGACLLALSDPHAARDAWDEALALLPSTRVRRRADVHLRLAHAHLELHDTAEVVRLAIIAYEGFAAAGATAGIRAVRRLRTKLIARAGNPAARALDDRINQDLRS